MRVLSIVCELCQGTPLQTVPSKLLPEKKN
jgi:hypothetical protein